MSLHLEFEPHSWYMGFAIKQPTNGWPTWSWTAFTDNGNTYRVDELEAKTLRGLRLISWALQRRTRDRDQRDHHGSASATTTTRHRIGSGNAGTGKPGTNHSPN